MNANTRVCETCLQAAAEEGLISDDEAAMFCTELGSELADHLCEEIELQGEVRCGCGCHRRTKQALRGESIALGGLSWTCSQPRSVKHYRLSGARKV